NTQFLPETGESDCRKFLTLLKTIGLLTHRCGYFAVFSKYGKKSLCKFVSQKWAMKTMLLKIWKFIYRLIRNKYLFSIVFFVVWISVFDTYNLIDRSVKISELRRLRVEREFFRKEIDEYNRQISELFSDKKKLEKFAREQYLMKNENEDIFIIINSEPN
ncbi:MAG TPA: hypothetical protein PLM49_05015, partial [Bacteroidales bacterium]|nr:hypothetical protein [Bacteroidales bacterium]